MKLQSCEGNSGQGVLGDFAFVWLLTDYFFRKAVSLIIRNSCLWNSRISLPLPASKASSPRYTAQTAHCYLGGNSRPILAICVFFRCEIRQATYS